MFPAAWSPRYVRPEVLAATGEYAALARSHGLSPAQMALAWCYSRWFVGSTIIGATTIEQLKENKENIDAFDIVLPGEVVAAIDAIHARMTNPGQ